MKSRRIAKDQYDTALLGYNKILACNKPNTEYYFVYKYTNGLFYIQYNKELFDTFRVEKYRRGERDDCLNSEADTIFIPTNLLIRIGDAVNM
jgi:hypothetical protein